MLRRRFPQPYPEAVAQAASDTIVRNANRSRRRRRLLFGMAVRWRGFTAPSLGVLACFLLAFPLAFARALLALALVLAFSGERRWLRVQPRSTREGTGRAAVRPAEVERPRDCLGDDAFFQVRVGDSQQRVHARLGADLRADRELSGDRLVA